MDRRRFRLAALTLVFGIALPFLTWAWAKAIDERLMFEDFPDPVLLVFNGIAFAALAAVSLFLPRAVAVGGLLGLAAISVQLHMAYWQSHSSTTALLFIFYLPWAGLASLSGLAVGFGFHKLFQRSSIAGYVLAATALLAYVAVNLHWANYGRFNRPPDVGVVESEGPPLAIEKTLLFTTEERLGALTSNELRRCIDDPEATLTLTGRGGVAFLTGGGELRRFVPFEEVAGFDVFPVDVDSDGICEFVDRAGGWQPVGLIDSEGRYVFRYGKPMTTRRPEKLVETEHSPTDIIPFDVGGDGRVEFLVPLLIVARNETHLVDRTGQKIRVLPENLEGSRALGTKLYTPSRGSLEIRDSDLKRQGELPLGWGSPSWSFVRWPDLRGEWHLAVFDGKALRIRDLTNGAERAELRGELGGAVAPLSLYVATAYQENRRQFLRVFDGGGRRVYEEVLDLGGALAAIDEKNFLISECTEDRCPTVWRYRLP